MNQRTPTSRIHLKRNSYESTYNPSKYSSARLLKTDRCHDSRTSFKGLEDYKYESEIMKRMITDTKEISLTQVPDSQLKRNDLIPITKALTERKNSDIEKQYQMGGFHKKKSIDRSNPDIIRRFPQIRTAELFYQPKHNKYHEMDTDFANKRYEQSESILVQKSKRINDLQRMNKFFTKRAEELSQTSEQLTKKNVALKTQLKYFESMMDSVMRLEQKYLELEKRDENNTLNYEVEKQQIYTLTKMC